MASNEQSYERMRAQVRSLDERLKRLEHAAGPGVARVVSPKASVTTVAAQGRGVPARMSVRRVGQPLSNGAVKPEAAEPIPSATSTQRGIESIAQTLGAVLDALQQLGLGVPAAAPPAPPPQPEAEAEGELDWIAKEGGAAPPPVVEG